MKYLRCIIKSFANFSDICTRLLRIAVSWYQSLKLNFAYLPFRQAIKMPIWVCNPCWYDGKYEGRIKIDSNLISSRMIKLGVNLQSWYPGNKITLQLKGGDIIFKGNCLVANGTCIYVGYGSTLILGNNVLISSNCKVISESGIRIGDNTRIGWNTLIMDTNFHFLRNNKTGKLSNIKSPINIGAHNWFGNGCSIYRGFTSCDYVTIGANTQCRGKIDIPYSVWGNDKGLNMIKEGVFRDLSMDNYDWSHIL